MYRVPTQTRDPLHVELFELAGVAIGLQQRELLAQTCPRGDRTFSMSIDRTKRNASPSCDSLNVDRDRARIAREPPRLTSVPVRSGEPGVQPEHRHDTP